MNVFYVLVVVTVVGRESRSDSYQSLVTAALTAVTASGRSRLCYASVGVTVCDWWKLWNTVVVVAVSLLRPGERILQGTSLYPTYPSCQSSFYKKPMIYPNVTVSQITLSFSSATSREVSKWWQVRLEAILQVFSFLSSAAEARPAVAPRGCVGWLVGG
jgi:hypothetical protein